MKNAARRPAYAMLLIAAVLYFPTVSRGDVRTWTDNSGTYRVQAELIDCVNGVVRLRKTDGQIVSVPLDRLSALDRALALPTQAAPAAAASASGVLIEFLIGSKVRGTMVSRDDQYVEFEVAIGSRTVRRKYPISKIHAITVDGSREVVNEEAAETDPPPGTGGRTTPSTNPRANPRPGTAGPSPTGARRSPAAVDALITRAGQSPPEWFDTVALNYPKSLDLNWPQPPPKGWNNQKNVGQYVWDIINRNPSKWREGVRFMYHMLEVHKENPATRRRVMNELGRMYFNLIQDYARAAYWWRQTGVDRGGVYPHSGIRLAECYWRLGSKPMAMDLLQRLPMQFSSLKLLGDMGEVRQALQILEPNTRGQAADVALIYAGDICRQAGMYQEARGYYNRLLALPAQGQSAKRIQRQQQLARPSLAAIEMFELLDIKRVPDGTYRAASLGYEADIHVEVVVANGKIESVRVTDHKEKQFFSALIDTPRKIVERQSVKGIDATSGATITAKAIVNATAKALAGAMP